MEAHSDKHLFIVTAWCIGAGLVGCAESPEAALPSEPGGESTITAAMGPTDAFGDTLLANAFRPGVQTLISASSCDNGDSVLLWADNARIGIFTRRFTAAGIPTQPRERSVDFTSNPVSGIGCFAVARVAPDGSSVGVYVSIYNRFGDLIVPEFRVNENTAGDQLAPRVAINASGAFVVTWQDAAANTVNAKLFRANGVAAAPAQTVFSSTINVANPHVAMNNLGDFVIGFEAFTNSSGLDVYFRRYSFTGFAVAAASIANTTTAGVQLNATPAITQSGDFWISWESAAGPATPWQVMGRHFNASGTAITGEIPINAAPPNGQPVQSTAAAANGTFLVAWTDFTLPGNVPQVLARKFSTNGTPLTDPFAVSTTSSLRNDSPQVVMDVEGNASIAWNQSATGDTDVAMRRYPPGGITVQAVDDGATLADLSGAGNSWQYFKLTVPSGQSVVDIAIFGDVGDADLYVRYGAVPGPSLWDARPFIEGSNEGVEMSNFPPGDWYIAINGFTAYSSLSLQVASR